MKNILLSFSIALLLSSCKEMQPVTIGGVENIKLQTLSTKGIEFDFTMKIKNPNTIAVTVFPSSFYIKVNDIDGGIIKLNKRVRIKANSDGSPTFHIKSDFSKLGLEDIAKVISIVTSQKASINLKGDVRVGKCFYKKRFPIEMTKSFNFSK